MPPRKGQPQRRSFSSDLKQAIRNDFIMQLRKFGIFRIEGVLLEKCTTDDLKYRLTQEHIRRENAQYRKGGA